MMRKLVGLGVFFLLTVTSQGHSTTTDATWTGPSTGGNANLKNPQNWNNNSPGGVPDGQATFDSTNGASQTPYDKTFPPFYVDTLHFNHSASDFTLNFDGPGALEITGAGITGATPAQTNPNIYAYNSSGSMYTPQVFFFPYYKQPSSSIGAASISANNTKDGVLTSKSGPGPFKNMAQVNLIDSSAAISIYKNGGFGFPHPYLNPVAVYDDASIYVRNYGYIYGYWSGVQTLISGNTIGYGTPANNVSIKVINSNNNVDEQRNIYAYYFIAGQLVVDAGSFYSGYSYPTYFLLGDNATFDFSNKYLGYIYGWEGCGQLVISGSHNDGLSTTASLVVGDHATLNFMNTSAQMFTKYNSASQLMMIGNKGIASLIANDYATFTFNNTNAGIFVNNREDFCAGQLVCDGNNGQAFVMTGDNATFTFNNSNGAQIGTSGALDCGQLVCHSNGGNASVSVGNGANFSFSNSGGTIGANTNVYSAGQIVLSGFSSSSSRGAAEFGAGDYANITLKNETGGRIQSVSFGAGQIVVTSENNVARFTTGKFTKLTLSNDSTSKIEGSLSGIPPNNAAQLMVTGFGGLGVFSIGDNSTVDVTNAGKILVHTQKNIPAQILFEGFSNNGVLLQTGNNVFITATNTPTGNIANTAYDPSNSPPPAQIYFSNTRVVGNPTITAINQYPGPLSPGAAAGIVFDGSSSAIGSNIALVNSLLLVNTDNSLNIASLTGDPSSLAVLNNGLVINTVSGARTTFAGVIEDGLNPHSLTISGAGTQVLTNSNTYTGGTTVTGGNLVVDGSIVGNLLVTGGMLSGIGSVGSVGSTTTVTGGIVKPGDSPGKLTNVGNYYQRGGALQIDLNGAGNVPGINNGWLVVGGDTQLSHNAFVIVNSVDGSFYIGDRYTIVTSTGPVTGMYDPVPVFNTSIQPIITYDSNHVYLDFQTPFLSCACDENGLSVAEQLISIKTPDAEQLALLAAITSQSCPQIGVSLDDLSGAKYADLMLGAELSTHQFVRRLFDPLRTFLAKDLSCCEYNSCCDQGFEGWFEGGGIQSRFKGRNHGCGKRGFKSNGYQLSGGAHMAGCDNTWIGGAALTYEHTTGKTHHALDAKTNTVIGGLYGAYRMCDYYVMGDLVFGGSETKVNRHLFIGGQHFHQRGKPEALQGILYAEFGKECRSGPCVVQPFLGLEGGYYSYKSFSEGDDSAASLRFKEKSYGTFDTRLGVHLAADELACGTFVGVDLAWQYRCTRLYNTLDAEFEFGEGFRVRGSKLDPNSFEAAVNVEQKIGESWSIYVSGFWQQWSQNSYAYDILGGVTFSW